MNKTTLKGTYLKKRKPTVANRNVPPEESGKKTLHQRGRTAKLPSARLWGSNNRVYMNGQVGCLNPTFDTLAGLPMKSKGNCLNT